MTTPWHTLETCLNQQLALAQQFLLALQEESRLLQNPAQANQLASTTASKLSCVQQFEALTNTRNQALLQLGYSPSPQGLEQALAQHSAMASQLQALQSLAQQASTLNTANGAAIHTYLRHTQQALSEIHQLSGQNTKPLYTASGRTSGGFRGRTHIKA